MSIFAELEAPEVKKTNPRDWSLEECKKNLRVQFRTLKNRPDCVSVSVRLGGVTALKIGENDKMAVTMLKTKSDKELILQTVIAQDGIIEEAKQRYVDSLNTARTTRNTTRVKPKDRKFESAAVINHVTTAQG